MKIDVERLMDLVEEENQAYVDYHMKSQSLHKGDWDKYGERKKELEYARHSHDRAEDATRAVIEVFGLDKDQIARLYIAARAARRWRERTRWEKLIPAGMQEQIRRFIFGPPAPIFHVCTYCLLYQREVAG
ncbi:MAG: hypothetical protein NC489_44780 [Ruminococcus flavefaciens]|nr:hypothetical protein [Ruminococcus flavefaciens]